MSLLKARDEIHGTEGRRGCGSTQRGEVEVLGERDQVQRTDKTFWRERQVTAQRTSSRHMSDRGDGGTRSWVPPLPQVEGSETFGERPTLDPHHPHRTFGSLLRRATLEGGTPRGGLGTLNKDQVDSCAYYTPRLSPCPSMSLLLRPTPESV